MKKIILIVFILLFSVTAFAQSPRAVNELSQLLSRYKTYKARFTQKTYFGSRQRPQISSGRLYMKRPGMFRWEVRHPNRQIIIANKSTLWIYDIDLQQATKEKINTRSSSNPAILLSGDVKQLIKQYNVSKIQSRGKIWYQLKPRSARSAFVRVRLRFSRNRLVAIWVENNLNQTSLFQFSNIQLNVPLSAALFNFKPPPGVNVLQ